MPALARVLAARGVRATAELDHAFTALPRPDVLLGAEAAARRLADAIAARERIVVVADYDADGATACAAALRGLRAMGGVVDFVVPNRFVHGYGLTPAIVDQAAALEPALLVTVDNGIASVDGVAAAAARGIDVLITDHHLPGPALPAPAIVVNPNQPGCGFPSRALAGVGVLFYVLAATRAELRRRGAPGGDIALGVLLDLVALGTVADVVPLDRVNRILVAQGLARLRTGRAAPGIAALFAVAGRRAEDATAADLGFVAGPRLNAAGRLDDMTLGIRCLVTDDADEAHALASTLDGLNRERRALEATMEEQALALIAGLGDDAFADRASIAIAHDDWHPGVVGIVASRLKDRFARPAIVFARGPDGAWRGSGRSVPGFHLRDALDGVTKRAPALVARFGGHAMAAGVTLAPGPIDGFVEVFEAVTADALGRGPRARVTDSDGPLAPGELTLALARAIEHEVWGQGFPPPAFDDALAVVEQRTVGSHHTRLVVEHAGTRHAAMLFRSTAPLPQRIRAVYRPEVNRWQGLETLQLTIAAWWPE
ncbi:MAG: single-stranded-DNA-specific exonuclease RecJ [Proteobacteria bacterium]|nr:single-stranded-DNA-specific exonuclease RecJ [Pseudomonadota bacterium]